MYSKIALLCILIGFCQAGVLVGEGHGQAFSSQSVVRHPQPYQLSNNYPSPVLQNSAPFFQAATPIAQQPASFFQHSAPLVQQSPILQQYSPVLPHPSISPVIQQAPIVQQVAPIAKVVAPIGYRQEDHFEAPAKYEFSYSVEDLHSGDQKSQHEIREGDVVRGEYSLVQPDGSIRKVEYNADDHNGFSATVHNSAPSGYAASANAHAPVFAQAPVVAQTPTASHSPIYAAYH